MKCPTEYPHSCKEFKLSNFKTSLLLSREEIRSLILLALFASAAAAETLL